MFTTILVAVSLLVDIGLGGKAWSHAKKVEHMVVKLDERLARLEPPLN